MTIQRQYFLPNCTLTLNGLSSASFSSEEEFRPSLDMLMQFECNFSALNEVISGGSDLLESLIQATNHCAQSWMSGIQYNRSQRKAQATTAVQLHPIETGGFKLSIPPNLLPESEDAPASSALELHLTSVQLFDLAEALDQLLSDSQTLPNLTAQIHPLSRRQALSEQPLAQKTAPLILGSLGFALSAAALFFVPFPEIKRPEIAPPPATTEPATPTTAPPSGTETDEKSDENAPDSTPDTPAAGETEAPQVEPKSEESTEE